MNETDENPAQHKEIPPAQDSTRDLIKLLISLASGVIALSAAFIEKLSAGVGFTIVTLYLSWIALATSIFFGVKALSRLVHAQQTDAKNWYEITLPPMRQCWRYFQAGVVLLIVYASIASGFRAWPKNQSSEERANSKVDTCSHTRRTWIDSTKCARAVNSKYDSIEHSIHSNQVPQPDGKQK